MSEPKIPPSESLSSALGSSPEFSREVLQDADQLGEILRGVVGLLRHPYDVNAVEAARHAAMAASHIADRLLHRLDALAAAGHVQAREERAKGEIPAVDVLTKEER